MKIATSLALLLISGSSFAASSSAPAGIAWEQGDVAAAFAKAKAEKKPLFLYWGATWCPPCNQIKATVFNQQRFIDRTKQFIPVYIDGDSAGAQKLASQFKVRGYPSMILFKPDGSEITRLPGEVDADRYLSTLELGLSNARPVKETLSTALAGEKLSSDDWRLLADYSWDSDQAQLVPEDQLAATLKTLAKSVPATESYASTHLQLKAIAQAAGDDKTTGSAEELALVHKVLADKQQTRDNFDVLVNSATEIVSYLSKAQTIERSKLSESWKKALQQLALDKTLSANDRLSALTSQVALAKLDAAKDSKLAAPMIKEVLERVAEADKTTTNGYERQSVISTAAYTLSEAGLLDESDALLKAELKRSHAPYYFMLSLGSNAKKRGDKTAALGWYEEAYKKSEGPATRVQWGSSYVSALVDLAPQNEERIEQTAQGILKEVAVTPNAFYERSRRSIEKIINKLASWNKDKQHDAAVGRVLTQLDGICSKLPASDPQRGVCQDLLKPKA
ncbi:MAG: thioredoxin family protein [Proteobacteria bacterium]|nr:thioredoxin family protein [Pseudomonadota bacterium]